MSSMSMTDAELRQELISFGYDVPISINREFLLKLVEKIKIEKGIHSPKTNPISPQTRVAENTKASQEPKAEVKKEEEPRKEKAAPRWKPEPDYKEEPKREAAPRWKPEPNHEEEPKKVNKAAPRSKPEPDYKEEPKKKAAPKSKPEPNYDEDIAGCENEEGKDTAGTPKKCCCPWTAMKGCAIPIVTVLGLMFVLCLGFEAVLHGFHKDWIYKATINGVKMLTIFGTCVASLYLSAKVILTYHQSKVEREAEFFALVETIVERLRKQHEAFRKSDGSIPYYLVVNHLRDDLLTVKERATTKKLALWTKAVDYIRHNESRIGEEIQHIGGVEFQVWRWLPATAAPTTTHAKAE